MHADETNEDKIIYKELSYRLNGILFQVHNELGRYCREKQYADLFESLLKKDNIPFFREMEISVEDIDYSRTNLVDFAVNGQILVDLKAKTVVTKDDYYQMQRYLQAGKFKLGLIVNFRNRYLKPIRIIRMNS